MEAPAPEVAPREGRVSRNGLSYEYAAQPIVAPREGRVSRNYAAYVIRFCRASRAPRGACE